MQQNFLWPTESSWTIVKTFLQAGTFREDILSRQVRFFANKATTLNISLNSIVLLAYVALSTKEEEFPKHK